MRIDNSLINSCKFYNVTDEDRVECINFLIPGEPLKATNVLQHSIPTVDDPDFFETI